MSIKQPTGGTVQAVDRALVIIELLAAEPEGMGVTEIAHKLNVSKSTVHRLLSSLSNKGYVQQDRNRDIYRLGFTFMEMGEIVADSLDIRKTARPILNDLARNIKSTVHLAILEKPYAVYIDKVETYSRLRLYSRIGRRSPLYCTGVGKALLAFQPTDIQKKLIKDQKMVRHTNNTITTEEELIKEIESIRREGIAYDREEHEQGVICVAAPVFNFHGQVIAAISVTMLNIESKQEYQDFIVQSMKQVATEISQRLGY